MALHFRICVNGEPIGLVVIRRLAEVRTGHPSLYQVSVEYPNYTKEWETTVEHIYEDGALVLIYKALAAILRLQKRKSRPGTSRPKHET